MFGGGKGNRADCDGDGQDLQDEMLTLTMELNVLADKEQATRKENEDLVQRWMDFAETRAEVMNRASNWE